MSVPGVSTSSSSEGGDIFGLASGDLYVNLLTVVNVLELTGVSGEVKETDETLPATGRGEFSDDSLTLISQDTVLKCEFLTCDPAAAFNRDCDSGDSLFKDEECGRLGSTISDENSYTDSVSLESTELEPL